MAGAAGDMFSGMSFSQTYFDPNSLPGGDSFDVEPRNDRSSMGRQLLSTQRNSTAAFFSQSKVAGLFDDSRDPQDLQLSKAGSLGRQAESRFSTEPTATFAKALRFPARHPQPGGSTEPPEFAKPSFDSTVKNEPAFSWTRADRAGPAAAAAPATDSYASPVLDTLGKKAPPVYKSAPALSMSGRNLFGTQTANEGEGPGPASFNPPSAFGGSNPVLAATPSVNIGKDSRFRNNVHTKRKKQAPRPEEPGPGSYDVCDKVVRRAVPAVTIGGRVKFGSTLVANLASASSSSSSSSRAPVNAASVKRLYGSQTAANRMRVLANERRAYFPSVWDD